jgi:hypothetical protein
VVGWGVPLFLEAKEGNAEGKCAAVVEIAGREADFSAALLTMRL